MADKFLTHTAEEVDDSIDNINSHKNNTNNPHSVNGSQITITGYEKAGATSAILSTDSVNEALGKLEKGLENKDANVQSDWNQNDSTADDFIKNKPDFQSPLTEVQLSAINSGINETKVQQIETNSSDIANLKQKTAIVYGFHINPDESDPSAAVTYLGDAVGMSPAKMGSSSFSYGSWADAFFMPKPCMVKPDATVDYYLDPNDYTKKIDGTASELAEIPTDNLLSNITYANNAMMEWPKIWFKYIPGVSDGEWSFYVSNQNVDGTYKCWCNINSKNQEIDHFYTPIYNGSGCNSKMRSVSGIVLTTENESDTTTATQEINAALANNSGSNVEWYIECWADRLLINALLYLIGKSLNLQGTFGQGISSGGQSLKQSYVTGSLNDKGLFYGNITGVTTAVKVFGMENLWGLCFRRIAGFFLDNGVVKVKMTYDILDGSTAHGYNMTGNGYINFGAIARESGYISKMKAANDKAYIPSEASASASTKYCDYIYINNQILAMLILGGSSSGGASCGFCCSLGNRPSDAFWNFSAALSLKPLLK